MQYAVESFQTALMHRSQCLFVQAALFVSTQLNMKNKRAVIYIYIEIKQTLGYLMVTCF